VIASGTVLALFGPQWWHVNTIGHWVNSAHLWSVQAFFFFMVLHLWGMFFQAAWRDGRGRTWVIGAITFVVSIMAAFTGYLLQSNHDSQWIAVSAKDAMNSIGIGGFFNALTFESSVNTTTLFNTCSETRSAAGVFPSVAHSARVRGRDTYTNMSRSRMSLRMCSRDARSSKSSSVAAMGTSPMFAIC
jgi:hypothetical protein